MRLWVKNQLSGQGKVCQKTKFVIVIYSILLPFLNANQPHNNREKKQGSVSSFN